MPEIKILLVDDEETLLEVSKIYLEKMNEKFNIITADSAVQALEMITQQEFDVIISDYQMPTMDGLEFLSKVREAGNEIPFIIFTGKGREEVAIQALNLGADFYLQKGGETTSQFHELENLIDKLFEKKQADKLRRHLLDQQISINKLALTLGETRDLNKIYKTIFQHIYAIMDADTFVVSFYDKNKLLISPGYALIEGKVIDITMFPPLPLKHKESEIQSKVILLGQHVYLPDLRRIEKYDKKTNKTTHHEGDYTKSAVYVPMKIGGDTIGVIEVQSYNVNAYSKQDIDLLSALANVAAVAIQNARLFNLQQQTNIELLGEQNKTQTYLDLVEVIIVVLDPAANIQMINKRGCEILGFTEELIVGKNWIEDFVPVEWKSKIKDKLTQMILDTTTPDHRFENPILTRDNKESIIAWKSHTIKDHQNRVTGILSSGVDITEQAKVEATLAASEKQYESTLNSLNDPLHVIDENLNIMLTNEAMIEWLKELKLSSDIIGKNVFDVFPFLPETIRDEYRQVFVTGQPLTNIETNKVDKKTVITETRKIPVFENGNIIRIITILRDITDQKNTELELIEAAEKYNILFEQSLNPIFLTNLQGNIIDTNKQTIDTFGYSKEELLKLAVFDLIAEKAPIEGIKTLKDLKFKKSLEIVEQMKRKNGETFYADVSISLIDRGNIELIQAVVRDITAQKTMEEVRVKRINDLMFLSNSAMHFVGQTFSKDIYQHIAEQVKDLAGEAYVITASFNKEKEIFNIKSLLGIKKHHKAIAKMVGKDLYKVEAKLNVEFMKKTPVGKLVLVEEDLNVISVGAISKRASNAIYNLLNIDKVYTTTFNKGTQIVGGLLILMKKGYELKNKNLIEAFASQASVAILRSETQTELIRSEAEQRQIIDSSPLGIHMYNLDKDKNLIFIGGNKSADKILGIKHNELIGKTILECFPNLEQTEIPKIYRDLALKGGTWTTEQISYDDESISGAFEVTAFQSKPGMTVVMFQDITDKALAKEDEQRNIRNLTFLSQTAMDIIGFSSELDFYNYIGERIKNLADKSVVAISSYDESTDEFTLQSLLGLGKNTSAVMKLVNKKLVGMKVKIKKKLLKVLLENGVNLVDLSLADLSEGMFPKKIANSLQKLLKVKEVYSIPFKRKGRLFGNVIIMKQEKKGVKNLQLLEAFANQASVAFLRRQAEEELLESEERFRTLIETMNDGLAIDDENGIFTYVNKKLCNMLGFSQDELLGNKVSNFLNEENRHTYAQRTVNRTSGVLESYEISWIRKDKSPIPTIISPQPIIDGEGSYRGSFAVITDITDRIQTEKQLREQQEELFKQRDALESFASTIAHDLRGKMQVISLYNSMTESEFSDKIGDSIEEMSDFIEDLLLLAKKGELLGDFKTTNLNTMAKEISDKVISLEPNLEIEIDKLPKINCDPIKMRQVFENLLMNVYKHAEASKVKIDAKDFKEYYKISVKDNGKGIAKDKKKEIIESWTTMRYTSFGLLIVLKIVQAHGGEMTLESEEGKGTTVIIKLPKN